MPSNGKGGRLIDLEMVNYFSSVSNVLVAKFMSRKLRKESARTLYGMICMSSQRAW